MHTQSTHLTLHGRVFSLQLEKSALLEYLDAVSSISVKDIDYIPYCRFLLARDFESIFNLHRTLHEALNDYHTGAVHIQCNGKLAESCSIKISTAIAYLLGTPQIDPLSGTHYALFTITHDDRQLPNLLRPYEPFKMHTDGAYMDKVPDWLLFMKIREKDAIGGQTRLLHVDDWAHFDTFYTKGDKRTFEFFSTPESSTRHTLPQNAVVAPLLHNNNGQRSIRFIDRFIYPKDIKEAEYIYELQETLENAPRSIDISLKTGGILLVNNHFWLHGRKAFARNQYLSRTLMRQRGYFHAQS